MRNIRKSLAVLFVILCTFLAFSQAQAAKLSFHNKSSYQQAIKASKSRGPTRQSSFVQQSKTSAIQAVTTTLFNGGFESGDFSGWIPGDNGLPALTPWMVCSAVSCGWSNQPIEGVFDSLNGFDGEAGYEAFLYQTISVPLEPTSLTFYDRIQYDGLGIPSFLPRTYEVQVRDATGALLQTLHHQEIFLNGQPYTDLGWQRRSFNISQYAGQIVQIYIRLHVPESFTGPAEIQFDNFLLEPASVGDLSGCVNQDGLPLAGRQVILLGDNLQPLTTVTGPSGCYSFPSPAPGTRFDIMIRNP